MGATAVILGAWGGLLGLVVVLTHHLAVGFYAVSDCQRPRLIGRSKTSITGDALVGKQHIRVASYRCFRRTQYHLYDRRSYAAQRLCLPVRCPRTL